MGVPDAEASRLTAATLNERRTVPCSSLLIRVVRAASENGRPLSVAEVPSSEWISSGLIQPMPDYHDGVYVSTATVPTGSELDLYASRLRRESRFVTVLDTLGAVGLDDRMDDDEALAWITNILVEVRRARSLARVCRRGQRGARGVCSAAVAVLR